MEQIILVVHLLIALAIVGLMHWSVNTKIDEAQSMAEERQRQIDQFGPQLKQVEEYRTVKADIERKLDVIGNLSDARSGPVHVFDQLSARVPERVWLSKIDIHDGKMTLQGLSLDNELVALFLTGLEDSTYFKQVELVRTEAQEQDGFRLNAFEVSAFLTSPAAERRTSEAAAMTNDQSGSASGARGLQRLTGKKL